jgi:ribosomal protein L37E
MAGLAFLIWLALIAAAALVTTAYGKRWLVRLLQAIDYWPEPEPGPAGPPKCPACGYNLYFAERRRCPECGRTFEIKELDMRLADWDGKVLRPKEA